MLKENLTLLIPVRDRQYNIPVVLEYYADLDCRKIIVDSSKEEYKGSFVPGFDYAFIGPTRYYEMMHWATDQVDTPYVLDASDDDFFWKEGIEKAIEFLLVHPDYSSCEGITKKIEAKGENGCAISAIWPAQQKVKETLWYEKHNMFERMIDFMTCYSSPKNHVVVKTKIAQDIAKIIVENKVLQSVSYLDRLFSLIVCFNGNMKVLPLLWCLRKHGDRLLNRAGIGQELNAEKHMKGLSKREVLCPVIDYFIKTAGRPEEEWEKVMLATKALMEQHFATPTSGLNRKSASEGMLGERLDAMDIERLIKVGEDEIKEIFIDFHKRKMIK